MDGFAHWNAAVERWKAQCDGSVNEDRLCTLLDTATAWMARRRLATPYLSPSANIWIWSEGSEVTLEWDNRSKLVDGVPAWSAQQGTYRLRRSDFVAEVRSLHTRLMAQIAERVQQVAKGALPGHIHVDVPNLLREQMEHSQSLEPALHVPVVTDWAAVRAAISELERNSGC